MTIYKFPQDKGRKHPQKKDAPKPNGQHEPEFIDIEDLQGEELFFEGEYSPSESLERIQMPVFVRILALVGSGFLFLGTVLWLFLFSACTALAIMAFHKWETVNHRAIRYWELTKRFSALSLGLGIIFFSPSLGLGFIALYFSLKGEDVQGTFLRRFFEQ